MSEIQQIVSRQVNRWNIERKAAHDESVSEDAVRIAQTRPIVTLSRQRGCRGHEIAKLLAYHLQYGHFDSEIVDFIARHLGVRSELVESLDEKDRSEMELWVRNLFASQVFDHDEYSRALAEVMRTAALQGGLVIVGRGGNFMLQNDNAFHVRIIAPLELRIKSLMETEGKTREAAVEDIEKTDHARSKFIRRYFKRDIDDPLGYNLTINLSHYPVHAVPKIVIAAMRARGWPLEFTGGDKRKRIKAA